VKSRRVALGALLLIALIGVLLWYGKTARVVAVDAAAPVGSHAPVRSPAGATQPVYPIGGRGESVAGTELGAFEGDVRSTTNGHPIANASITLIGPSGSVTGKSDATGHFSIAPPTEGLYDVMLVQADGFTAFSVDSGEAPIQLRAARGTSLKGLTLWLEPAEIYTVHVERDSGDPESGAEVRVEADSAVYKTDEKGEVKVTAHDGLVVEAKGKTAMGSARIEASATISHVVRIVLSRAVPPPASFVAVTGRVTDSTGLAQPDVLVSATAEDEKEPSAAKTTRTDGKGNFGFSLLPATYRFVAEDGHYGPAALTVPIQAAQPPITLVLTNAAVLRGTVTDESGKPVPGFSILVARPSGLRRETVTTRTFLDGSGHYEIGALPAGAHVVTVLSGKYAPTDEKSVSLNVGDVTTADFVLKAGARLTGTVRDSKSKAPIADASVALEGYYGVGSGAAPLVATAFTDQIGHFTVEGIGKGQHSVLASADGHHARVVGFTVTDGESPAPVDIGLTPTEKGEEPRVELVGIGAVLSAKDDALVLGKVLPGGGASEAGLAEGDRILHVDGQAVTELGFSGATQKIRGPEGTSVSLGVVKNGSTTEVQLNVPRRSVKT
jgi:hypothetical protein